MKSYPTLIGGNDFIEQWRKNRSILQEILGFETEKSSNQGNV